MKFKQLNILIPTYEPGEYITELLTALSLYSTQLQLPIHVYISDDCSPNFSISALGQLPWSSSFVLHYYRNTRNLNECSNVNDAVARLFDEGHEWFLLLHQDDLPTAEWLATCASYVSSWGPGMPTLVHSLYTNVQDVRNAMPAGNRPSDEWSRFSANFGVTIPSGQAGLDYISDHWVWVPSGTLFRTKDYLAMFGFHPGLRFAADCDFLVRWLLAGLPVHEIEQRLMFKRIHERSQTSRAVLNGWDNEGFCYLMQRFANHRTRQRNRMEHISWFRRNISGIISGLIRRDARLVFSRAVGIAMVLRSWLAIEIPYLARLLPGEVKCLLKHAPPTIDASDDNRIHVTPRSCEEIARTI